MTGKTVHLAMAMATGLAACAPGSMPSTSKATVDGEVHLLGQTVASLGDPTIPGLWLRTTLVKTQTNGQVRNARTGTTVAMELRPMPGAKDAGAQASRAAMGALGVALTDLPVVDVYGITQPSGR